MAQLVRPLVVAVIVISALAARADADVFKVFGEAHGGGVFGKGLSGDAVTAGEDFFSNVPHGMYGARVGARLWILEGVIQHHQFTNGKRLATWTQFAAGVGFQSDLGSEQEKKARKGSFIDAGVNLAFGLGTGQQVDPPLSNDEVTDKGFLIEGRIGFGKHLNKVLDIGFTVPVSWGYLFKNGFGNSANDTTKQYRSLQAEGLVYLRVNIKLL